VLFDHWDRRRKLLRQAVRESVKSGVAVDEALAAIRRRDAASLERATLSRGDLLRRGAAAGATALLPPFAFTRRRSSPRVVVVGAGNAGLTAAYRIHASSGWPVAVYEANTRVGGRTWTDKSFMAGNQWFEHGGGGVNTNELNQPNGIGALVRELGLGPMYDLWLHYPNGGTEYYFDGAFGFDAAAYRQAVTIATRQFAACLWPFTYASHNANNVRYDAMSGAEWIAQHVPGGLDGSAGADLAGAVLGGEYGGRASDISAFHLIADLGGTFWRYPEHTYDERWGVPGGNDNLAKTLAARLPGGSVHLAQTLVAIRRNSDGSYTLSFQSGHTTSDVGADKVVIAIPTGMMQRVDYSNAGFSAVKIASFSEPNGSNCKLTFQFSDQVWKDNAHSGDAATDTAATEDWQGSYINPNGHYGGSAFAPPIWVVLNNVPYPSEPAHGPASSALVAAYLSVADTLFPHPKASSRFIPGKAWLDNWPLDPYAGGSYSYYRPGQWTRFGGAQSAAEGSVHFAGEHTAPYTERGMMNGAVLSGERAAREVLR
jgi:monoamine oxidase